MKRLPNPNTMAQIIAAKIPAEAMLRDYQPTIAIEPLEGYRAYLSDFGADAIFCDVAPMYSGITLASAIVPNVAAALEFAKRHAEIDEAETAKLIQEMLG